MFSGKEKEQTGEKQYKISAPKNMTHDGGISKDDDMVMSYNVEFDMIKLAKEAMKNAGFKKKDL